MVANDDDAGELFAQSSGWLLALMMMPLMRSAQATDGRDKHPPPPDCLFLLPPPVNNSSSSRCQFFGWKKLVVVFVVLAATVRSIRAHPKNCQLNDDGAEVE